MAINKVEANGETLIDLTNDTVTADTLISGRTAHLASGEKVTGKFEPVTGVKGNAESAYRKGNVNLTPANIGAATSAQGTKADSAVQTIKMNGSTVTKTDGVVDLGTVIKAHQDISGKADKSATVSNVTYDTTNKKLTKTINGTTSDIITTAQLKTDMALSKSDVGLGNVGNFKAVSTVASQGLTDTEKANARTNIGAGTSSFSGSYNDLSNKPTIPAAVAVKGNAESTYRTGNVNLTPANIGAATSAQGTKADSAVQTIQIGGTAQTKTDGVVNLPAYPTKSSLGLGNVDNTSDANKPVSTAAQAALDKQQAQIDYNSNQGVKNLVKITADTRTISGVTFTVDKVAGTVTANGTSTSQIAFKLTDYLSTSILQVGNTYILSGCPAGGNYTSTYALYVFNASTGSTVWADVGLSGGSSYVIPSDIRLSPLCILIRSGVTVSNLVFKPMIRDASIKDNTFQPYAMSNADLTQKALIKEDDNAGGYVVDFDKDCKLQRNANYIRLGNNSININADSSNINLQCGTTGSPLRGVSITSTAVRMYFGLNTLTVNEDGLWFNDTKIAE